MRVRAEIFWELSYMMLMSRVHHKFFPHKLRTLAQCHHFYLDSPTNLHASDIFIQQVEQTVYIFHSPNHCGVILLAKTTTTMFRISKHFFLLFLLLLLLLFFSHIDTLGILARITIDTRNTIVVLALESHYLIYVL